MSCLGMTGITESSVKAFANIVGQRTNLLIKGMSLCSAQITHDLSMALSQC